MKSEDGLLFRPFEEADMPFLHSSWGSSYYSGSPAYKYLLPHEFHFFHKPIRERFFQRPTATVIVCSPDDDPWLIVGWIAVEKITSGIVLQYLYVKNAFKQQGIASGLIKRAIPTSPVFYTHLTDRARTIMAKHYDRFNGFKHIPHLV